MGKRNPLNDENFVSVLSEVVWGLHVYGRYGGEQKKAVKAFSKRVPGYSPDVYQEMFESSRQVLTTTIEAVEKAPKSPKPGQEFSEYTDVDVEYVLERLRTQFHGRPNELLKSHIGMTIYYYYLR